MKGKVRLNQMEKLYWRLEKGGQWQCVCVFIGVSRLYTGVLCVRVCAYSSVFVGK